MRLKVRHETLYRYDAAASYSIQYVRLTPRSNAAQHVVSWRLTAPGRVRAIVDPFGNLTHVVVLDRPHGEVRVGVVGEVESADTDGIWPEDEELHPPLVYLRATPLSAADAPLADFAAEFRDAVARDQLRGLEAMMQEVRSRVAYVSGITHVGTTAAEAWDTRNGVCQDHAHVFLACCRSLGVPARYVSGYLFPDPGASEMASHAWVEALAPDIGWVGLDVTNGVRAGERHIRLACGLDYLDASPVRGMRRGGGKERMHVRVFVTDGQPTVEEHHQQRQQQQQ